MTGYPQYSKTEEQLNIGLHALGFLLSVGGLFALLLRSRLSIADHASIDMGARRRGFLHLGRKSLQHQGITAEPCDLSPVCIDRQQLPFCGGVFLHCLGLSVVMC